MPKPRPAARTSRPAARPRYSPHPMLQREGCAAKRIEEATGRTMAQWSALARKHGFGKPGECAAWLREEHGVAPGNAMWIGSYVTSKDEADDYQDPERLVANLYSGPRAALRPLHERLVDEILALGDEVLVTACKTMVPAYRKHAFAELRPADGGVELALSLGDVRAKGRLRARSGGAPGERIAHRVIVRAETDIDAELRGWLARAYELGAGKIARAAAAETPGELASALAASAPASATWESCTPAMRRDFAEWITSAKQDATRARRVAQAVERLAAGKRRMY